MRKILTWRQGIGRFKVEEELMVYGILAEAVVVLHFLWIVFLVAGGLWGRKHLAVGVLHIGGLGLALALQVLGWFCPLTYLEVWLKKLQDPASGYEGSFIVHYLERAVYPDIPMRFIFIMTIALCLGNALMYGRRLWGRHNDPPAF